MELLDRVLERLLTKERIKIYLVILIGEIVIFLAGTVWPTSPATTQILNQTYKNTTQSISTAITSGSPISPLFVWAFIFSHNSLVTFVEAIPLLGVYVVSSAAFTTGQVLHSAVLSGTQFPINNALFLGLALFLFPHSIVEFSGYAVSAASSLFFIYALYKREPFYDALKTFGLGLLASLFLVNFAALIETLTSFNATVGGVMWFPVVYGFYNLRRWVKTKEQLGMFK